MVHSCLLEEKGTGYFLLDLVLFIGHIVPWYELSFTCKDCERGIAESLFKVACPLFYFLSPFLFSVPFFIFITHVYMSMFAIKGAIHSIINGHMEEEEVKILHSSYYKKLQKEGKV